MTTEKKNYNFTLNINYLLYTSKSISFSHTFVYYRSTLLVHSFNVAGNNETEPEHWYRELRKIKNYQKYFQILNVVSCVPYPIVHRPQLQWTRGERVPLSLAERTFFAVLHFRFITAFQTRPKKGDGFFRFQTITGAQVRFLQRFSSLSFLLSVYGLAFFSFFLFLHRLSSLFFLLLLYDLAFPHFFTARHVTNAAVSLWESDKISYARLNRLNSPSPNERVTSEKLNHLNTVNCCSVSFHN